MSATLESNTTSVDQVVAAPVQTGGKRRVRKQTTKKTTTKTATKKTTTKNKTKKAADKDKIKTVGSRREVWNGRAKKTSGGLTKANLILNSSGKPVSKAQHEKGIKQFPVLKPWRDHLNAFRVAHPEMSLKEQMKGASKTYQKKKAADAKKAGASKPKKKPSGGKKPKKQKKQKKPKKQKAGKGNH
jgi:hypothetical protein